MVARLNRAAVARSLRITVTATSSMSVAGWSADPPDHTRVRHMRLHRYRRICPKVQIRTSAVEEIRLLRRMTSTGRSQAIANECSNRCGLSALPNAAIPSGGTGRSRSLVREKKFGAPPRPHRVVLRKLPTHNYCGGIGSRTVNSLPCRRPALAALTRPP